MTQSDLSGRTALVTGGAQGLGEGMARALAAAGARVVVADLQVDAGTKVADSLGEGHGFVELDVTDESSWENAVTATASGYGGLDILVNNAGVEISSLITEVDPKDIRTMLEVNILGTALGIKWGLRTMRPDGPPAAAAASSTSPRWRRRSPSRASRSTRPPSPPSTGSPASPRWRPASSATASA